MSEAFLKTLNMSISASWLVLVVFMFRLLLKKAPKWVNVLLWGLVAIRLICPISIESSLSLIPDWQIGMHDQEVCPARIANVYRITVAEQASSIPMFPPKPSSRGLVQAHFFCHWMVKPTGIF